MPIYTNTAIDNIRSEWMDARVEEIKTVREYVRGDQASMMNPGQRQLVFRGQKIHQMADNVLRLILRTAASRLTFQGWEVEEAPEEAGDTAEEGEANEAAVGPVKDYLDGVYLRNRLGFIQRQVHIAMLRDADHAVSLGWRGGRARVYRQPWWDGETGIFVSYDTYGDAEFAVNEWIERDPETGKQNRRRTVYYPDHFIRFWMNGSGWEPIKAEDAESPEEDQGTDVEGVATILPDGSTRWEKGAGDPLGIPVIHFANGSRDDSPYGESDLTGLLGLQDEINSMQHDIAATSKFTGFQMIWTKGQSASGKIIVGPGRLLEFEDRAGASSSGAPAGVLPPGDISSLTKAHAYKRETMAIDAQSPIHMIGTGQWPSGEAILQADMPLVDKTNDLIEIVGPAWSTVGHRITEIANVKDPSLSLDEEAPITALMEDPRRIDDLTAVRIQSERVRMIETLSRIPELTLVKKADILTPQEFDAFRQEREGSEEERAAEEERQRQAEEEAARIAEEEQQQDQSAAPGGAVSEF